MGEINKVIRGRKLSKYREMRGLTKEDMATRLGVSPNTYGRYEKGEFEPKVEQWEQIAGILNVPLEELLTTEPIVIIMHGSQMANFGSQNHQHFPLELVNKLTEQFEARIAALENANQRYMDMIERMMAKN